MGTWIQKRQFSREFHQDKLTNQHLIDTNLPHGKLVTVNYTPIFSVISLILRSTD